MVSCSRIMGMMTNDKIPDGQCIGANQYWGKPIISARRRMRKLCCSALTITKSPVYVVRAMDLDMTGLSSRVQRWTLAMDRTSSISDTAMHRLELGLGRGLNTDTTTS